MIGLWVALIRVYATTKPDIPHPFTPLPVLAPLAFAMTFSTNVIIAIMVIARLVYLIRKTRKFTSSQSIRFYQRVMAITVESGLLYPLMLIIMSVFTYSQNYGLEILSGSNTQIIGLTPLLLALQLRFDLSLHDIMTRSDSVQQTSINLGSAAVVNTRTTHASADMWPESSETELGSQSQSRATKVSWNPSTVATPVYTLFRKE